MDGQISKIIAQIKEKNPHEPISTVEQSFDFLLRNIKTKSAEIQQSILTDSIKSAAKYSLKPIKTDFIATLILNPLVCYNSKLLETIKTEFPIEIQQLLQAYCLLYNNTRETNLYQRNLFEHSINTALLVAELKLNYKTIAAALLKHLPEFSPITHEQIQNQFDDEILQLVINTNKLKEIHTISKQSDVKHLRQTFLAMAKDLRVIIIKICSLIDLLKHIEEVPKSQRIRLANEAMTIYAPIADIIGAWRLKWQLEDYAFKYLNPTAYQMIAQKFNIDEKKNREKYIEKTKNILQKEANKQGIKCQIDGRFKHFYSIYSKMQEKKKRFDEVNDVFALRIVVDTISDCYLMLGIIHSIWPPKPRRVKDYIAQPKSNNYRSLHTTVFGLNRRLTEFQIRTTEMDDEAKFGVAGHWYYKNNANKTPQWIKTILEEQTKASSDQEFLEKIKTEMLIDKIFVYTPKGDIISLPKGATAIDFAYQVHTDIGDHCQGALINDLPAPLDRPLAMEDIVEIIIDENQPGPQKSWLEFTKTSLARKHIKNKGV